LPDKALGKITNDWEGGYIRLRLFVGQYGEYEDTLEPGNWSHQPSPPPRDAKTLMCNLFQAKNLPSADSNALADPFVIFYCGGEEIQTRKDEKLETLNPMWYRSLPLSVRCGDVSDAPPVIVYVMDYDEIGDNDLIGMCVLTCDNASMNDPTPMKPEWIDLSMGKKGCELGQILISFNMFTTSNIPRYDLMPEVVDTSVEINVLGLRDLKPALGWVPVTKPFVKFDLNSLQMPGEEIKIRNVQTQPKEPGANPNINTIIKLNIKMPVDPLFCPALTASVYDHLFMGLS